MRRLLPLLLGMLFLGTSCAGPPWHRAAGDYVVVQPGPRESLESVAESFGGGEAGLRCIETLNPRDLTPRNTPLLVPAKPAYELGIRSGGYQVVPVLLYRWGNAPGEGLAPARVQADLLQLETSGYSLLTPDDFLAFISMERSVPERSVLLAFEVHEAEGFRTFLARMAGHGPVGLLFVDPAEVGGEAALTWEELGRLAEGGLEPSLVPVRGAGLAVPGDRESLVGYTRRVKEAITSSHALLARNVRGPVRFAAYPDNQGNSIMASVMVSLGVEGVFRQGEEGNPFFCDRLSVVLMDVGHRGAGVPLNRYLDTFRKADLAW